MFEWDEAKRLWTIGNRGLDFVDATLAFDGRPVVHFSARLGSEQRMMTIAMINGKSYAVVWTWRGSNRRIISFRRARDEEEEQYRALYR
ncbi:MAG TPA: BrnT family toxin [Rhizomicrobium sp.]|jgi:hypothetical protein